MSYKTGFLCLLIISASLSGCAAADAACEKVVELDREFGEWDEAFLYIAKRVGAATGHYEIVGLVKIVEGVKWICAGEQCVVNDDIDACVTFVTDKMEPETEILVGLAWDEYSEGDEIDQEDLEKTIVMDWGNWTSDNYYIF